MPRRPDRVLRFAWNPGVGEAIEPPADEAESGWSTGQRPPAQYFNALFNNAGHWLSYLAGPSLTVWASHVYPDADDAFLAPIRAAVDESSEDSAEARYRYVVATTDDTGSCVLVSRRGTEWLLRRNFPGTPDPFVGVAIGGGYWFVWSASAVYATGLDDPSRPDSGSGASALRDSGEEWYESTLPASPGTLRDLASDTFGVGGGRAVLSTSTKLLVSNSQGLSFTDSGTAGRQSGRACAVGRGISATTGIEISSDAGDGYIVRAANILGTWSHVQTLTGVGSATSWRLAVGPVDDSNLTTFVAYKTGVSDPRLHLSVDDGVTWTPVAAVSPPQNMTSLHYRDEVWVATCTTAPYALASSDLERWIALDTPVGESGASLYDVVYGNNAWLLLSDDRALRGAPAIVTAEDTWSADPTPSVLANAGYLLGAEIDDTAPTYGQVHVYTAPGTWVPTTLTPGGSSVSTRTATYTAVAGDVVLCDATAGVFTVTLPTAAAAFIAGRSISVKKVDSSGNAVTVDGNGAEAIDGAANLSLSTQYAGATFWSDGFNWWVF